MDSPYFLRPLRPRLNAYIQSIRRGQDGDLPRRARADRFWRTARIARHDGMALLGTELGPDWSVDHGDYTFGPGAQELAWRPRATTSPHR